MPASRPELSSCPGPCRCRRICSRRSVRDDCLAIQRRRSTWPWVGFYPLSLGRRTLVEVGTLVKALVRCAIFAGNLQRNVEKCFCCSCRNEVFHRTTRSDQLATIRKLATSARSSAVDQIHKETCAREKLRCELLEGCCTVQQRLQVAAIVAKCITGLFVQRCAQQRQRQQKTCVASCWRGVTLCNGSCKLL